MQHARADAGAVDHRAGLVLVALGNHQPVAIRGGLDLQHGVAQHKLRAVFRRAVRQGAGHLIGTDQGAGGRIQGAHNRRVGVGLHLQNFIVLHNAAAGHVVGLRLCEQVVQGRTVLLAEAQHQRAGLGVGHAQLLGQVAVHHAALHVQARLFGARMRVKTGVHDTAVGLAGAVRHILHAINNQELAVVLGHLLCYRAADHTGADDDCVVHCFIPFKFCRRPHAETAECIYQTVEL